MAPQIAELQRVPEIADENDVMREQLEYLIEHATRETQCGCAECQRYLRVRALLLEIFQEPCARTQVFLAKAA
jgi:hypothetical protein